MWLLRRTGDPSRRANFGRKMSEPGESWEFSFDAFQFPACRACNEYGANLEERTAPIVAKLLSDGELSARAAEPVVRIWGSGAVSGTAEPKSRSATRNAQCQADIAASQAQGCTDFRVNQQQVDANGVRVGTNRPDVQSTDPNGTRQYQEYDTRSSGRGPAHGTRIGNNDPAGATTLLIVP